MIKSYKDFHKLNESASEFEVEIKTGDRLIDQAIISQETVIKIQDILDAERGTRVEIEATKELIKKPIDLNEVSDNMIAKKVAEINDLIAKAIDEDGDKIGVVDRTGTWQSTMYYKPIVYRNGALFIEYEEEAGRYPKEINKERINKSNMELDGIPTLNNIAKMYRYALKKANISLNEEQVKSHYDLLFLDKIIACLNQNGINAKIDKERGIITLIGDEGYDESITLEYKY